MRLPKKPSQLYGISIVFFFALLLIVISRFTKVDYTQIGKTPISLWLGVVVPDALTTIVLFIFLSLVGWISPLFSKKNTSNIPKIVYIIPFLVVTICFYRLVFQQARLSDLDILIPALIGTVLVGIFEETLTRGVVIYNLRAKIRNEFLIVLIASVVFGLLHSINLLGGQALFPTLLQMGINILFGFYMYASYRVMGTLLLPIFLHFLWDFSLIISASVSFGTVALHGNIIEGLMLGSLILATFILLPFYTRPLLKGKK